ncbi:MAG TPA: cytochrome P450 [Anaerolineales bacterium]|nr:cytochrome P450 [Anaerolineales bacterium]
MATQSIASKLASIPGTPPGPKGLPLIGVASDVLKDPLGFFMGTFEEYGDVARFHVGNKQFIMLNHPDHVQYVLQGNHTNYHKGPNYKNLRPFLGNGLVTSESPFWLRQRRLIQPAFHRKRLGNFALVMAESAQEMLDRWQPYSQNGQAFNIADEFMRVTLQVVSRAMFSTGTDGFADVIGQNLPVVLERTNERFWEIFDTSGLPTAANRRYWQAIQALDSVVYRVIDERRKNPEKPDDLLTMLLEAIDEESGEQMTDQQLRDEVMTIFLAGHETTANALSWTYTLLAGHPEIAGKLRTEVDVVLQGRRPVFEDLPNLKYTRMVIDEVLRLYPSVWAIARTPIQPDEVGGYRLDPGVNVAITPYITHRHPAFWDNPEEFDPERFSPERSAGRHPFAYFPFGGGPRLCIGNNFALTEATLILAMITQRYELELLPDQKIVMQPVVTLRPRDGIRMRVHPRK